MRAKMTLLATLLIFGISFELLAQQPVRGSRPNVPTQQNPDGRIKQGNPSTQTVAVLPDLVATGIYYEQANKLRVRILNQGNGDAKSCYLALMILKENGPASAPQKVWSVAIPPLKAHKGYSAIISIAPFTYADHAFLARIDRSDVVKESDESNNDRFDNSKVIH
jgi:hypothetical protein